MVSAVGMGANRFKHEIISTPEGVERCAQLVVEAAALGVNFFDSAAAYSGGKCEEILRLALRQIAGKPYICGKSSSHQEKTRDAVQRHIERSLKNIGIDYFDFYYMWSVKSIGQYQEIMATGGPYEGVVAAKERGLVKHICFSSHASAQDTVQIIEDGAFEGVLLSYSLLNFRENNIALETAERSGLGVAVMNPLGGGIIPQNAELFKPAVLNDDIGISDAALKFIYVHTAVSTILCGVENELELAANVKSLSVMDQKAGIRQTYVTANLGAFSEFCTGCGYCNGCPAGIKVSALMTAFNQTRFKSDTFIYNRTSTELIKQGNFFRAIEGHTEFENSVNPCLNCGKCEKVCTQRLPIIDRISEIYRWVEVSCASLFDRKKRLESLLSNQYSRVGFYTAGGYTDFIIKLYKRLLGDFSFEVYVFDSNPLRWGGELSGGIFIRNPEEIPGLNLDVVLISNYVYSDQIYEDLTVRFPTVNVQRLHTDNDVPWIF
ncbi:aldo/keto reductase [Desulfitobacterium sp. LBE]|uniref:aldo/keto reductase n=1 Tax=Desulfitobacterium sp. LBE TaxID=884086 RepID=UPI00119D5E69|nr:aldo/keto reductase [Desulfitobacterium sp. LBE]